MDVNSKFNYYEVLEVSPLSPQNEVNLAYERLRLTYSGQNPAIYTIFSQEEAKEMLALVEEAFAVLGNKAARTSYDQQMSIKPPKTPEANYAAERINTLRTQLDVPKKNNLLRPEFTTDTDKENDIKLRTDWSGADLRMVREYKNWTVEAMAETTKISSYYIRGVEAVDPNALPAAVFVRGYVSQICRILGLDERKVCESYMKHFKISLDKK